MRYVWLLIFAVMIAGCTGTVENTNQVAEVDSEMADNSDKMESSESMEKHDSEMEIVEVSLDGPFYEPFTLTRYEEAKSSGKIILIEFYANWCPKCAAQQPNIEAAFEEITNPEIVGFRVNYRDSDTDETEVEIARKFGISYQHSHLIIDSEENVLLKEIATQWSKEQVLEKISEAGGLDV